MAPRGRLAAARGAWLVFEDEAGFSMTPSHAKAWSQRSRTPVERVRLYLPAYAPDLNPVEGIWSLLHRGWLSNIAFSTPEHLNRTLRSDLRHIQYHSNLIDGCLTETGLTIKST
ncbi:transposase [Streptomyces halstedii]|uniref:transposase n=1 Tax=Streptomyces halstedii TaxID=1944 RepID=UPI0033A20E52